MSYYDRGPTCKNCAPQDEEWWAKHGHKRLGFWDTWSEEGVAICANCGHKRPYHKRKAKKDTITPSQQKQVDRLKWFFTEKEWPYGEEPTQFDVALQEETGWVYVTVETSDNLMTQTGGHFKIGRRGGLEILSVRGLHKNNKQHAEYLATMLDGKVSKYL